MHILFILHRKYMVTKRFCRAFKLNIKDTKTILPYIIHIYFFLERMAKNLHMILLEEYK